MAGYVGDQRQFEHSAGSTAEVNHDIAAAHLWIARKQICGIEWQSNIVNFAMNCYRVAFRSGGAKNEGADDQRLEQ